LPSLRRSRTARSQMAFWRKRWRSLPQPIGADDDAAAETASHTSQLYWQAASRPGLLVNSRPGEVCGSADGERRVLPQSGTPGMRLGWVAWREGTVSVAGRQRLIRQPEGRARAQAEDASDAERLAHRHSWLIIVRSVARATSGGRLGCFRPVDRLQIGHDQLAVLPQPALAKAGDTKASELQIR
jgi:hypothetical protein